jgi:adenosylhomocysteine nucleosidase
MIAITFALPQESADFVARLCGVNKISGGALPALRGEFANRAIVVCHTGVGADSTGACISKLLNEHRIESLISSGFAGGLDPKLETGDLIFAENFSDPALLDKARALSIAGVRMHFGVLTTQPHAAETVEDKRRLARETSAVAVDMETAHIFEACKRHGVPMLSVRGISDAATQRLPVPAPVWFDARKQRPRTGALLFYLARRPWLIAEFARFTRGIFATRRKIAECLATLVAELATDARSGRQSG